MIIKCALKDGFPLKEKKKLSEPFIDCEQEGQNHNLFKYLIKKKNFEKKNNSKAIRFG